MNDDKMTFKIVNEEGKEVENQEEEKENIEESKGLRR